MEGQCDCANMQREGGHTRLWQLSKESEAIHIPGIDVGGGWRTGCGSHPPSAERLEELEDSVWSVVRQENEREEGERVQNSGKTSTDVWAEI